MQCVCCQMSPIRGRAPPASHARRCAASRQRQQPGSSTQQPGRGSNQGQQCAEAGRGSNQRQRVQRTEAAHQSIRLAIDRAWTSGSMACYGCRGPEKKKRGGGKGKVRKEGTYLWPDRRKVAHAVAHFGTIRGRRQGPTRIGTVRKIRTDDRQRRRTPGQGGALTLKQGVHVCRGAGRARPAAVPTVPSGTWGYWDS